MSKIAGWIDYNTDLTNKTAVTDDMSVSLSKTGGALGGIYLQKEAVFLFRSANEGENQPFVKHIKGENFTVVYSGKLYNLNEIKNELACLGYNTTGESEAEVIINAYAQWGEKCVDKFNGSFAFAVWKEKEKSLFAARDRVGANPFFYYTYKGGIIFASDINTLLKNPLIKPVVDEEGLKELFLIGPGKPCGSGIIKGIQELKCGYMLNFNAKYCQIKQYWRLKACEFKDNVTSAADYLRYLISDSVKLQLAGKTDVACMLSGGLDSSILSYLTAKEYEKKGVKLKTYSVNYKDNDKYFQKNRFQPDSDEKYIPLMTDFLQCENKNIMLDNDAVADSVIESAYFRGLPGMADVDSALLLFLREIGKTSKICFTGECSDEFFGGYPWYHDQEMLSADTFPWSRSMQLRKKLVKKGIINNCEEYVYNLFSKTVNETDYLPDDSTQDRHIREMFMLNFYWFMQTLIDRNGTMSAAAGIETRVPFCDHRIIEYAFNMPYEIKAYNKREKGILREAFKDILPSEIVWRKKSPFPKSCNPTIYNSAKQKLRQIMSEKKGVLPLVLNESYINELMEIPPEQTENFYGQLMRLPQLFGFLVQIDAIFNKYNITLA